MFGNTLVCVFCRRLDALGLFPNLTRMPRSTVGWFFVPRGMFTRDALESASLVTLKLKPHDARKGPTGCDLAPTTMVYCDKCFVCQACLLDRQTETPAPRRCLLLD